ncbi:hypothetical protein EG329_004873 [Mollisiaceae sp. DMI_Dod_QoI]|nr:hypothetical protein EG329_004873 [Helotiales sp. DMI_Dod_QoI]
MAAQTHGAITIEATSHIPIAQLTPLLAAPATRSIKAIVTLTWPYSSATGSIAFLLSEPDFRLRRTKGQVRVQFAASSAKSVVKAGIASGDEVILRLDGVEWLEEQNDAVTPGRGLGFELKFTERLNLQVKQEGSPEISTIDIDHPVPEAEVVLIPARIPTPEPLPSLPATNGISVQPDTTLQAADEWSSPAFLKRARTSYGSLFDSDYNPFFEEDGSVYGKGRKRTRLSSTWRYSSRSPTPEEEDQAMEEAVAEPLPKPVPMMMDEACQTVGLEFGVAAEALADFARQATNIGSTSYSQPNGTKLSKVGKQAEAVQGMDTFVMQPPRIHTQQLGLGPDQVADFNHEAPSSPRLHPIPSDSLPLVSPLITHTYGIDFDPSGPATQDAPFDHQLTVPNGTSTIDEEDIYGASPVGRRGVLERHGSNGFQEPPAESHDDVEFPTAGGPYAVEDQYGHWQNAHAQLSRSASPPKTEDYHEEPQMDQSYDNQGQYQYEEGLQTSHDDESRVGQYPELDLDMVDGVRYPDISDQKNDLEDEDAAYTLPPPRPSATSRSQSAQSPVVDLTEDSDEGEEEEEDEDQSSLRESEAEVESEEDKPLGEYNDRDGSREIQAQHGRYVQQNYDSGSSDVSDGEAEGSQDLEDEKGYYVDKEAEEDQAKELEQDPHQQQAFHTHNGERFDNDAEEEEEEEEEGSYDEEEDEEDEEGSYDEDEMGEDEAQAGPSVSSKPIVIDLLSSDDEDAEESANVPGKRQTPPTETQLPPEDSASESDESDSEDTNDENDIPYSERAEIRTYIQQDRRPHIAHQEEDVMHDEEDAKDFGNGRHNEAQYTDIQHGDESADMEVSQHVTASSSDRPDHEIGEDHESEGSVREEKLVEEGDSRDLDARDEPHTSENKEQSNIEQIGSPRQLIDVESVKKSEQSPRQHSLFARVFNFDGANDEHSPPRVSYPSLPNDEASLSANVYNQEANSQDLVGEFIMNTNAQLPTPEATQLTDKDVSADASSYTTIQKTGEELVISDVDQNSVEVEVSTKLEVTTQAASASASVDTNTNSDSLPATSESTKLEAVETDRASMVEDVVMAEEDFRQDEIVEQVATAEASDIVMIEETAEKLENSKVNFLSQKDGSPAIESASERGASSEPDASTQNGGIIMMKEVTETNTNALAIQKGSDKDTIHLTEATVQSREANPSTAELTTEALSEAEGANETDHEADESISEQPATDYVQKIQNQVPIEEPQFTVEHPRRSHRRVKSTNSTIKTEEDTRPVTPVKVHAANGSDRDTNEVHSPMVIIDAHATPKGHDASIELALSSLESPSKQPHDLRKPPVADLKLRLSRALRTELSEFTALKVLRYHMNQKLDVLAVATTTPPEPQRAKGGPRQYQITFNITDPSISPSGVTEVQVFRPYSHALPTVSAGDGILLRNFQVTSVKKGFALRSTQDEGSSWAVFKDSEEPEIRGPPVEYGDGERNHISALKAWYGTLDDVAKAKIDRANGDKAATRR